MTLASPLPRDGRTTVEVRTVDPSQGALWSNLLSRGEQGSVFSAPPWFAALRDAYRLEVRAAVAVTAHGEPTAALPYCVLDDELGLRLRTLPFSDYCDVVGDPSCSGPLLGHLARLEGSHVFRFRTDAAVPPGADAPWPDALAEHGYRAAGAAAWHGVLLPADPGDALGHLGGSSRRNIRAARSNGVSVAVRDDLGALRTFYDMHVALRKGKYRMLAQPWAFFEALHQHFGKGCETLVASHEGRDVATVVLLTWQDTMYYKFNASTDTSVRPNDLLVATALELAAARGLRRFDFGLSDLDQPGLLRFKEKFATERRLILTGRSKFDRAGAATRTFATTLGELTRLFTDPAVPDAVAAQAGNVLYRYFA